MSAYFLMFCELFCTLFFVQAWELSYEKKHDKMFPVVGLVFMACILVGIGRIVSLVSIALIARALRGRAILWAFSLRFSAPICCRLRRGRMAFKPLPRAVCAVVDLRLRRGHHTVVPWSWWHCAVAAWCPGANGCSQALSRFLNGGWRNPCFW